MYFGSNSKSITLDKLLSMEITKDTEFMGNLDLSFLKIGETYLNDLSYYYVYMVLEKDRLRKHPNFIFNDDVISAINDMCSLKDMSVFDNICVFKDTIKNFYLTLCKYKKYAKLDNTFSDILPISKELQAYLSKYAEQSDLCKEAMNIENMSRQTASFDPVFGCGMRFNLSEEQFKIRDEVYDIKNRLDSLQTLLSNYSQCTEKYKNTAYVLDNMYVFKDAIKNLQLALSKYQEYAELHNEVLTYKVSRKKVGDAYVEEVDKSKPIHTYCTYQISCIQDKIEALISVESMINDLVNSDDRLNKVITLALDGVSIPTHIDLNFTRAQKHMKIYFDTAFKNTVNDVVVYLLDKYLKHNILSLEDTIWLLLLIVYGNRSFNNIQTHLYKLLKKSHK